MFASKIHSKFMQTMAQVLGSWEQSIPASEKNKRPMLYLQVGGLFTGLVLFGVFFFSNCLPDDSYREIRPERGDLTAHIYASGRVQPDNRVDIRAPIPGRIENILVREGDNVKQGQILAWMSSNERAAIIDAARVMGADEARHWEERNPATPVIAPVDGLIIQRNIEAGQSFSTSDPILVLSDRFVVEAPVDETDVARIKEGQSATTTLDAFPNAPLESKVLRVAHESTQINNVTSYNMEIELKNPPDYVRVGMTANVSFETLSKKDTILIPSEALKATENEIYVMASSRKGASPEKRKIQIGLSDNNMTEVLSGLSESDYVYIQQPKAPAKKSESQPKGIFSM